MARDFRNLEVFRAADALLFRVFAVIAKASVHERVAICDQLRRAALSVPLNLVEGSQRTTSREYARFVEIAAGSAAEVRYLLSVAARLAPGSDEWPALEREYDTLTRRLHVLRVRLGNEQVAASTSVPHGAR